MILVTHDLPVVAQVCDRAAVMYAGEIAETGPMEELYHDPRHPYTRMLFAATPDLYGSGAVASIPGAPPRLDRGDHRLRVPAALRRAARAVRNRPSRAAPDAAAATWPPATARGHASTEPAEAQMSDTRRSCPPRTGAGQPASGQRRLAQVQPGEVAGRLARPC